MLLRGWFTAIRLTLASAWGGCASPNTNIDGKDYGFEFDFTRIQRSKKNTSHNDISLHLEIFPKASFGNYHALIDSNFENLKTRNACTHTFET